MKRILIVRTDRVGDVIMITPMIRELKLKYPDSFIATLTQKNTTDILLNNPYLDEMITDDLKKETFWEVTKKIRERKFTDGLLVMPTERAAYQMFFGGVKNRIGVGRKIYEMMTMMKSVSRNNYVPLRHEADYCMDLARRIGVETDNISPEIFLTDDEILLTRNFLKELNINSQVPNVMIHTGSKNSAPNWSEDKYFELIQKIQKEYSEKGLNIFLTSIEMSESFKSKIKNLNCGNIFIVADKLYPLRKFISFINAMDLVVVSSTGPAHIADALKRKAVVMHCNRNVSSVKHWGTINGNSIDLEVSNEFCNLHCSKDKNNCGIENGITIETVLDSIKKQILKIN
ncbi:MAG TPA: hypothetical protein DEP28_01070 [Bacteroidetes bacterium]|nr:glycosyltransferase family 9 protein [Ignavibacteria bacterium]HCA41824.1 hypothetical protein [Bacteroidota bacterium]HCN37103.1 hypothetical protein [Bacteroidota bacterium]